MEVEGNVSVWLFRGDTDLGLDQGIVFLDDGRLAFRGKRSAFLLPAEGWTRRRSRIGYAAGAVLDVDDGATLFFRPDRGRDSTALSALLAIAKNSPPHPDAPVEWPSHESIGTYAPRSYRRHRWRIVGLLLICGVPYSVAMGLIAPFTSIIGGLIVLPGVLYILASPHPADRISRRRPELIVLIFIMMLAAAGMALYWWRPSVTVWSMAGGFLAGLAAMAATGSLIWTGFRIAKWRSDRAAAAIVARETAPETAPTETVPTETVPGETVPGESGEADRVAA